jgi:uroporphyrinogen decarboxylase
MMRNEMPSFAQGSPFMEVLAGRKPVRRPIWLMRQAGRYLPEYREIRQKAGSFLDLCYTPDLATEVTLQPIRRFGFDAAILFSDILVVPHAFGQKVWFAEGEGPKLEPIADIVGLDALGQGIDLERLAPVFSAIGQIRAALPHDVPLIGFCGAPWTVASYMIAGKGTPDQAPARVVAYRDPEFLQAMVDRLVDGSIAYLCRQVEAGVQVLQIFESFGGALPPALQPRWSIDPIARIVAGVKARHPHVPVIVFGRGTGDGVVNYARTGAAALGLDWQFDPGRIDAVLPPGLPVQGNLDPLALVAGGGPLDEAVRRIVEGVGDRPHVFNLGHGIVPQTPIAHVERLVERVRNADRS